MKASKVTRKPKARTVALPVVLTIGHSTHSLEGWNDLGLAKVSPPLEN